MLDVRFCFTGVAPGEHMRDACQVEFLNVADICEAMREFATLGYKLDEPFNPHMAPIRLYFRCRTCEVWTRETVVFHGGRTYCSRVCSQGAIRLLERSDY